jgi:adenylate cyclase
MGVDEVGTLRRLNAHRAELIDPLVEQYGGRIVKTTGDGLLLEFSSVVAAVECAVATQQGIAERNRDVPDNNAIRFRIGVHLGDVIVEGDDIFGDGVNIASRVEGLAEVGGVAVTGDAHRQVQDRLDLIWQDGGEHEVKNIVRPVEVWRWLTERGGTVAADLTNAPLAIFDKPSIAVLPFDNMSGDPEQEYFSDGIAEDVITALSKVDWLFVIARNSTFTYKGSAVDVKRVARDLGVQYVVEGSVRKAANRVRVSAQLIDGRTGNHIWADHYDRELDDIFALQDEITETIVVRINIEVGGHEMERARRKTPTSLNAWEFYQRGLWHMHKSTRDDNREARSFFKKAIRADPNFATAHAGIAYTHYNSVFRGYDDNPSEGLSQAQTASERSIQLDDKDSFSHFVLGRVLAITGQGERAIAEMEKSVALNPNYAQGYQGLGLVLCWSGRAADGEAVIDIAMRLSPQDPDLWRFFVVKAAACNNLRKHDEAAKWARKAINERADQLWPLVNLAIALAGQNLLEEARLVGKDLLRLDPDFSLSKLDTYSPHFYPEYRDIWIKALRAAGLPG